MSEPITGAESVTADEGGVDVPVDVAAIVAKHQANLYTPVDAPAPAPATPEVAAQPSAVAQAAAQVLGSPAPTPPAVDPAAPPEPTLRAKQLAALARLEAEARTAKEQYEAKLRDLESKPKEPTAQAPESLEDFREMLEIDPDAALASLGIKDRSSISTRLMYALLGAEAPPELKADMENRRTQAELAALRRKVDRQDKAGQDAQHKAAFAARVEATDRELQSFVSSVPAEFKYLAAEARENSAEVYQGLCTITTSHIQAGRFPSAREVAQALEDTLAADYARLSRAHGTQAAPPPASPAPAQSPPRSMETLNDADTRARPGMGDQPTAEQLADSDYWIQKGMAKLRALGHR